ncbi:MAG: hypothetical protein IKX40_01260 [Thermoguttaceae bacterium]|nr:hypothetical protein [Thermoguttaceae bacterium]
MKIRSELSRLWNAVFNPAPQRRSRRVNYSTCCRLEVLEDRDLLSVSPMQAPISNEQLAINQENATAYCLLSTASDTTSDSDFYRGLTHPGSPSSFLASDTVEVSELSFSALKNAIAFVNAGGTITFSPSLAGGTLTLPTSDYTTGYLSDIYSFSIQKSLTIDASGMNISIVGDGIFGIFTITGADTEVTLRGLTLTNGGTRYLSGSTFGSPAGAVTIQSGKLTLDGCTVADSQVGIFNWDTLEILNSTVRDNADVGIKSLGTLTVVSSEISGNAEGGIANFGSATLVNSLIVNNVSSSYGAGICNTSITYTISGSSTTYSATNLDIYNCTISGNWSSGSYGFAAGLANAEDTATVNFYNSVITGNGGEASIASSAADFYNWGTMTFNNSRYGTGYLNKYVGDLSVEFAGFKVAPQFDSSGNLVSAPNYRLVSDSVLKDAGNNSYLAASGYSIPNDVSGVGVRTYDSTVDIGAFEYQPAIYMDQPTLSVDGDPTSDSISLSWTAVDNFGYQLEYSTNSDFSTGVVTQTLNSSATSATFNSLDSNQTYYFRLKALGPSGSEDYQDSLWSTVSATTATTGSLQDLIHVDWSGVFYNGAVQTPIVTTSGAVSYSYTVTYNGSTTNNAFPTMKNVGVYNLSICFSAAGYDDYTTSSSFVISAAPVTISSLIANGRDYEAGNFSATVNSYTLSGVANGESLVLSAANGVFDSDQAGLRYATFDVALNNGANALASNYTLVDSNGNAITTARTTQAALISNTTYMVPTVIYSNGILSFDWQNIGSATDYTFRYKFNNTEVNGSSYSNYYTLNLTDSYCSFDMIPGTTVQYQYKPASGSAWSDVFTYSIASVDTSLWNVDIDGTSTNVFTLHSKADWATDASCKTIYLDFNGHLTYDTQWNTSYSRDVVVTPSCLDEFTAEDIYFIWREVCEDYAIYDVDVTTQFTSLDDLLITPPSDKKYGMRAAIGGTSEDVLGLNVGGIAYEGVFSRFYGTSNSSKQYSPAFVFPGSLSNYEPKFVGDAIAHEIGHTLGLKHDGYGSAEYYSGTSGWGPIMGDPYHQVLSQWSKGEYTGATNTTQDDIAQINEHLSFKTDNDNSAAAATVLTVDSTGVCASGVITSSSSTYAYNGSQIDKDYDWYQLSLERGTYTFVVGGEYSSTAENNITNLNAHVDVYCDTDSNYSAVATAAPHTGQDADIVETITITVSTAGVYYLRVTGEGKGTPVNGVYSAGDYSDYGSLGNYTINCTQFVVEETPSTVVTTLSDVVDPFDYLISLREAILYASSGDTITFDSSLNGSTITLNQSDGFGALSIDKAVSIDASALSSGLTINGNSGQIFDVTESGELSLNGLTITGADNALELSGGTPIAGWGGAIYAEGDVAIANCTFDANHAGFGSVIYTTADLTIESSVIFNNSSDAYGGAIYIASTDSVVTISDSQFDSNASGTVYNTYGGAILNTGNMTISGCEFTSNSASYLGGAIYHEGYVSTLTISDSVFSGNSAPTGGGAIMLNNCGSTVITNSLFYDNTGYYGSAIHNNVYDYANENNSYNSATFTLVNVTIAKNASSAGGALYSVSNAYLYNTIVQADGGVALYKMQGDTGTGSMWGQNNLISSMYGSFTPGDETIDGGYSSGSPTFINASGNYSLKTDFALTPNSLGVDDGDNDIAAQFGLTSQSTDIVGASRIYNNTNIDLGAFESQTIAQPLDAPVVSSSVNGTNVTISWNAVENASTYTITYQITGDEMTDSPWYTISGLTSRSFTLPKLINGVTVTARVQADATDTNAKSSWSETSCSTAALDLSGYNVDLDGDGVKETNVFNLSSKPDSNYTIYLDFTGHLVTATGWNGDEYGDIIRVDASIGSYYSAADILYIWRTVAEDYAPFDVNVTTAFPGLDAILYDNTESDLQWGKRIVIGKNYGMNSDNSSPTYSNVSTSGVSFVGTFQEMVEDVAYVWLRGKKYDAESVTHEAGHTLGLYHDGSSVYSGNSVYFSGREYWAPIMGSGYSYSMVQWTMGEYPGAQTVTNNSGETLNKLDECQNELLIISSYIPFIDDDVASVSTDAAHTLDGSPMVLLDSAPDLGQSTTISCTGMIGRQTIGEGEDAVLSDPDNDVYTLALDVGSVNLTIKGVDSFGYAYADMGYSYNLTNLDVKAELFDSEWNSIYVYDSDWSSDATIQCSISAAGTYYLVISGDSRGELGADGGYWYTDQNGATKLGYSNYGSLGRYKINGTVSSNLGEISGVSVSGYTGTYDGAVHGLIQSVTGLEQDDVVSYSTDGVQWTSTLPEATNAGEYSVWVKVERAGYADYVSSEIVSTIGKATLTASADNLSIIYGDAAPAYSVTYTGFVNGENASVIDMIAAATSSYAQYNNVGSYTITASGATDNNYNFVYQTGTLTVGQKAVTVVFDGYSGLKYNGAVQTISATVSGIVNNDNAGLTMSYNKTVKDAGAYTAIASISNTNYVLTGTPTQNFSIGKATLTATADDQSIIYGDAAPAYTVTYTGFVNGENKSVIDTHAAATSSYAQYNNVGSYTITASGASDNNYDFVYQTGTLTVGQKAVTVSFDDYSGLVYNGQEQAISAAVSGTINNENAGLSLSYNKTVLDAGSYIATASISNGNYVLTGTTTQSFSIEKATLTAAADNKAITYGDASPAYTVTFTGFVNGEDESVINTKPSARSSYSQFSAVGQYSITVGRGSDNNYKFVYQPGTLTVDQKAVTIEFDDYDGLIYNGQEQGISATVSGTVNGDDAGVSLSYNKIAKDAGSYTATASISNGNYVLTGSTMQNFSIGKATLTATVDDKAITYGDAAPTYTVTYAGFVNGENASVIDTLAAATSNYTQFDNVGEYVITSSGASDNNYDFVYQTGMLNVGQKSVTVAFENYQGLIYNGQEQTISAAISGTVNGDDAGLSLSYNKTVKDAGAYTATASISNGNYVLTGSATQNFSIGKATLTATADSKSITYGDAAPAYTVTYTGFVSGENESVIDTKATVTSSYSQFNNVGEYAINVSGASDNNYNFVYQTGTLTVGQKAVTVAFDDYSGLVYNGQERTISATVSGTVNGDDAGLSLSYNTNVKDVGSYTATAAISNANYLLTGTTTQNFSIRKATLIAMADNKSITYGDAAPDYTVTYTGFANGENESVIDTKAAATSNYALFDNVGEYAISASGASDNNYDFVYQTGTLNVGQKAVTVAFDDYSGLVYNGQERTISAAISGTVNNDDPGLSLTYDKTVKDAGSYTATASISNTNYVLTGTTTQNFSIDKATLTAKADNQSITYGDAAPAFTVTFTGFVNGEDESEINVRPSARSSYTQFSGVGEYSISVGRGSDNNYKFVYESGTLTVEQKSVTVSFDDYEGLIYNGQEQTISAAISGTVNNDDAILLLTYDKTVKDAGSYTATASISNGNYVLTGTTTQNFSIGKATLTAMADDKTITYGDAASDYTVSYVGFLNGENESVIDTKAIAASSYTQFDNVGEYTITAFGASDNNYDFEYFTGTLTVEQKSVTVTFDGYDGLIYNGQERTISASVSGTVNGDDVCLSLSYNKTVKDAGSYTSTASISNANYVLTGPTTQYFSIGKATLTATADDKTIIYGDAAPEYTVSYVGFVNGENESVIDTKAIAASSYAQYSNVGEYTITVSGALDNNYDFNYQSGLLTVGQKTVTVSFDNYQGLIYSGEVQTISAEVLGTVNNDNAGLSLSYNKIVNDAGSYTATASVSNTNYVLTGATTQDFSIGKATLIATADDKSIIYGDAAPDYTVSYVGFVNGEDESVIDTLAAAASSYVQFDSVGGYAITASGASDNNYDFVYQSGTLTVGQKAVMVAFDDYDGLIYNGQERTISASFSGTVNGDNPGLSLSYDKTVKDAGTYTATASISNTNYVLTGTTEQNFSIGKATLTATADNQIITYGDAAPEYTVSYVGFVNGEDEAVIDTLATATSNYAQFDNVGEYVVTPSGAEDNNYDFEYQPATLTVELPPVSFYGTIQTENTKTDVENTTSADSIPESIASIDNWTGFYLEVWTDGYVVQSYTTSIVYDSTIYAPVLSSLQSPAGVDVVVNSIDDSDPRVTTMSITVSPAESSSPEEGTAFLMAQIEFEPVSSNGDPNGGLPINSTGNPISVGSNDVETAIVPYDYDLNCDERVDVNDFILFATVYGTNTDEASIDSSSLSDQMKQIACAADFDNSGSVNVDDFILFAINYGMVKNVASAPAALPAGLPTNLFAFLTPQTTVEHTAAVERTPSSVEPPETPAPVPLPPASVQTVESCQLKTTDVYTVASIERTTSVTAVPESDAIPVQTLDAALNSMDFTLQEADVNLNENAGLFISEESQTVSEVNLVDAVLDELDAEFEWEELI